MLPSYHYEDNSDGNLTKSAGKYLRNYTISGNSIQEGTPTPDTPIEIESVGDKSFNLFDYKKVNSGSGYGVHFNNNDDGTFTANGMMTGSTSVFNLIQGVDLNSFVIGETYYISCGADYRGDTKRYYLFLQINNSETGAIRYCSSDYNKTFTLSENEYIYYMQIRIYAIPPAELFEVSDLVFSPMICKYSEFKGYQPYWEGYKVPVRVSGKNLIRPQDIYSVSSNNSYSECVEDGRNCIRFIDGSKALYDGYKFKEGVQYTVSFCVKSEIKSAGNTNGSHAFTFWYSDNTYNMIGVKQESDWSDVTLTSTKGKDVVACGLVSYNYVNWIYVDVDTFQLEEGTEATPYEPYFEPKVYNIYLNEPLRKVGDYADYIDGKRKKVVRNINYIDLSDGSWSFQVAQNRWLTSAFRNLFKRWEGSNIAFNGFCDTHKIYSYDELGSSSGDTKIGLAVYPNNGNLFVRNGSSEIIPTGYLYFDQIEPIEEDVDLPDILTEKGTNIITVGTELQPSSINYQYYKGGN